MAVMGLEPTTTQFLNEHSPRPVWPVWLNGQVTYTSDMAPVSRKEFIDTQASIECGFTLKHVPDMIKTYSQALTSVRVSPRNYTN